MTLLDAGRPPYPTGEEAPGSAPHRADTEHRRHRRTRGDEHLADFSVSTVNQDGTAVITGTATARLDP